MKPGRLTACSRMTSMTRLTSSARCEESTVQTLIRIGDSIAVSLGAYRSRGVAAIRLEERRVIVFGLIGVGRREATDSTVEAGTAAEISGNRDRLPRTGVR